jgi:hypothetical protein
MQTLPKKLLQPKVLNQALNQALKQRSISLELLSSYHPNNQLTKNLKQSVGLVFTAHSTNIGDQSRSTLLGEEEDYDRFISQSTDLIKSASLTNLRHPKLQQDILSQNLTQPIRLVFTAHPTNLLFLSKPTLWQEVKYYYGLISKSTNIKNSVLAGSWIGSDFDRHPQEQKYILTYAFLQSMRSGHLQNGIEEYHNHTIMQIDELCGILTNIFESNLLKKDNHDCHENQEFDTEQEMEIYGKLEIIAKAMDREGVNKNPETIPLCGLPLQIRISSDDLKSQEGVSKIKSRVTEIGQIQKFFGTNFMPEMIIADCTVVDEVIILRSILQENNLSNIKITALIEDFIPDDTIKNIIDSADKIMLAGSDSIQRITYVGTLLMKMNIQELLHEYNKDKDAKDKKILFIGAGNTPNRNGCILRSRIGTFVLDLSFDITMQGAQAIAYIESQEYCNYINKTLQSSPRAKITDIEEAKPIFEKIFDILSTKQISIQKEPGYTGFFDTEKVSQFTACNSTCGSRLKEPEKLVESSDYWSISIEEKNLEWFIKSQRAITQSAIHNKMHFHPEMLYWDDLPAELRNQIKQNINNPFVKDFVNQYTAIWQACDLEESRKWIKDDTFYAEFVKSYKVFNEFIQEIKNMPSCPKDLLLCDIEDHRPRFDLSHEAISKNEMNEMRKVYQKTKILRSEPKVITLLQTTGFGFTTSQ